MNVAAVLDRRTLVRVPIHERVAFFVTDSSIDDVAGDADGEDPRRTRIGVASDICIGGASIQTAEPGPFGSAITLVITLDGAEYAIDGIIRWIRGAAMGVQFQSLGVRETHAITELARSASIARMESDVAS